MQYVNFGTTGLQISRLGFGGIPIQRIDQPGTRELLIAAHKAGINYIDTARAYTVSEEWIGQSLEEAGLRDDFILATKCRALTKADMEAEIATSLKNLRTDHIELFQFHNPSMEGLQTILAPGGAMEALLEAKAKGVVGHIGITAHLAAVFEAALDIPEIETIMFPYNIVEQQGKELIDRCAAAGKGFIDMKPLAGGAIEDGRLALRYVLSNPAVTVAILNTMWIWNDYLLPYLVLGTEKKTVPVAIQIAMQGAYGSTDYGGLMAMLVLAMIPIVVFYLFCQKYIIIFAKIYILFTGILLIGLYRYDNCPLAIIIV